MSTFPKITNGEIWDAIRAKFPTFESHTAKATKDLFTDAGFEALKTGSYPEALNDFFELTLRVYLQQVNVSRAFDNLSRDGFGEYYDQPYGGYIQRMSINSLKPISPAFKNLVEGKSVDPFIVRKPVVNERIFKQNFDYQSLITIPDDFQMKQIFISEFGMSEFMGGLMTALENGYVIQQYENKLEALNSYLNSTAYPLQDTQKIEVALSPDPNADELIPVILTVNNIVSAMTLGPQSSAFNSAYYATVQDKSRLKLLVRPGLKNAIKVKVLANAYNQENLNLDVDVIEVPHFGGLKPYKEAEFTTPLYPVYDDMGVVKGYSETEGSTEATVEEADVYWKDPNADVVGIIADKGLLFNSIQNPYRVEPIRNPRGLYTNYWASSPNNAICVDYIYNCVVIKNS